MRISRFLVTAVALAASLSVVDAQARGRGPGLPAPLKVTIPGYSDGGAIPSTYGCVAGKSANISPTIQWSGAPEGTESFAVILHDPDVMLGADDVLHWAIFNIPATASGLPEGVPDKDKLDDGSQQLMSVARRVGYFNPCPPPPTLHHYILEVFAVDSKLDSSINSRADLMKALAGHVKAKGTYVGTYHQ